MLTRFRQLYNTLTHNSHAFSEEGPVDNSKIDKKTFTPHNLRAILLGRDEAIAVYFTTNSKDLQLTKRITLKNGIEGLNTNQNVKWYSANMKEEYGLIDALWFDKGLNFSYVEEIYLFTDGFTEEEKNKEIQRATLFANNEKIKTSMKRLLGIGIVDSPYSLKQVTDINTKKPIYESLDALGIPYRVHAKFSPERTSLGLLLNQGLNSGKDGYELDSKYSEDLPESEKGKDKYKLSKYFYEQTKRAEQAKRAKEEAAKKAALEISKAEMNSLLNDLWEDVKPTYTDLYKDAVENGLKGILVPTGYLTYSKEKGIHTVNDFWAQTLYSSIETASGKGFKISETQKLNSLKLSDLINNNYFSQFHAYNAFGITREGEKSRKWDDVINAIEKRFKDLAGTFFSQADKTNITDLYGEIIKKLTNCIVLERYNRSATISMKYKMDGMSTTYGKFFEENCFNITKKESCKVLNNSVSQNNVTTLFGVFDAKKFAAEALFSYQAYENLIRNGRKPTLENVIVGRNLDGTDNRYSLKSNDTRVTAIFAGSGSGKGVMTLGLLTSIVANKVPFIYLDYKPDMAEMLWDIEQELKSNGVCRTDGKEARILAIDAKLDMDTCNPVRKHRFAENLPDYLGHIPNTTFAVLPYLKLLQLYYILGSIRANESNKPAFGGSMTFAILDEFQANIKENLSKLITTLDSEVKIAKETGDERHPQMKTYVQKLKILITRLANETGTFINTDGRKSQCKAIYLGQNADYTVWKSDKVVEVKNLASEWYSNTSFRFFGRNGGTGSYAPANSGAIKEFVNNEDTFGYWTYAIGAGQVDKVKDWKVFKAYSVLNENDFNMNDPSASGRCTAGVLGNTKDDTVREDLINNVFVMDDGAGNKIIRPEVGFLGLVRKLSGFSDNELADALSEGYEVIWKVMCKYGLDKLYPDIESYLFDASLESIYTTDEIRQGVNATKAEMKSFEDISVFDSPSEVYLDEEVLEDFAAPAPTADYAAESISQPVSTPTYEDMDYEEPTKSAPTSVPSYRKEEAQYRPQNRQQVQDIPHNTQKAELSWAEQRRQDTMKEWQCYTGKIKIENNPFELYKSGSNTDALLSVKEMTKILREDIEKHIGAPNMITSFSVSAGNLFFNDIAYIPEFDESFIQTLPYVYQEKVRAGILADFFDLRTVYKYKNLNEFYLIDWDLAQGRARKEMGIGFRKKWNVLFKRFKYLNYIEIGQGDSIIYERDYPDSNKEDRFLDMFEKRPETTYSSKRSTGMLDRVWDSKPVRVITGAIGWTAGVQAVWLLASIMGPWGLLFGGLAAAGAYREYKNDSVNQARLSGTSSSNSGFSNVYDNNKNSGKKKKKK